MDFGINSIFIVLALALPSALVILANWLLPQKLSRALIWLILGLVWAATIWLWYDYNQQSDDVGLMISGILSMAVTVAALAATITNVIIRLRAR